MDSNSKSSNNSAILLLSHGSSLPYGKETFSEIHKKFKDATGLPTEVGYMKVEEPSIAGAIDILKEENPNLDRIIALPVFLAAGIHTNIDIPILLGLNPLETDPRCPDGDYPDNHYLMTADKVDFDGDIELLGPIGPDDGLLKFINKRIEEALAESKLDADAKTAILLVSHGSRLNYNKEFISTLHAKFAESTDYPTNFGFMELVEPTIPQSIDKLVSENDVERLIVVPVFLAPGVHTTRDIPTILGLIEPEEHHHHHHHEHEHNHEHGHGHHHHHHHHHDLEKIDFDGEVLYPNPLGSDDILIEILKNKVDDIL